MMIEIKPIEMTGRGYKHNIPFDNFKIGRKVKLFSQIFTIEKSVNNVFIGTTLDKAGSPKGGELNNIYISKREVWRTPIGRKDNDVLA